MSVDEENRVPAMKISIYPNPFCHFSVLSYTLKYLSDVTITIHNIRGQIVHDSFFGDQEVGDHYFELGGILNDMTTGIYFLSIKTERESQVEKILFLGSNI